ncbi:sialidase family protein [Mobiluncus porci]|uniref:exo-alpha-sialidase n=1 Tax=Mobiluncus porci TaxID=2652278 RepID=A0A7K0K2M2_9ACTO|nr:sialidase family protein [Mobiluncus porci]MST49295.1 exo-alpha-sialidase [Mobiluncus porci]
MFPLATSGSYPDLDSTSEGALPPNPCFRIPALAAFSAASAHPGRLLAAFDIRPDFHDLPGKIALGTRFSDDSGRTWSPLQVLKPARDGWGFGDASLISTSRGEMLALFVASRGRNFWDEAEAGAEWRLLQGHSQDGVTWDFTDLTAQLWDESTGSMFFASGNGIELREARSRGRLLQPIVWRARGSTETLAGVAISDNGGQSWSRPRAAGFRRPVGIPGGDESKVVELPGGDVLLSSRAYPRRRWAISCDGGQSFGSVWSEVADPGCNAGLAVFDDEIILTSLFPPALVEDSAESQPMGTVLCSQNGSRLDPSAGKSSSRQDWSARSNLVLRRGKCSAVDSGKPRLTWSPPRVIDSGQAAYSVAIPLGNHIAIAWERGQNSPYGSLAFTIVDY